MASHMTCGPLRLQVERQASVNLLGDFGGLSSLGFDLLPGGEFVRWVGRYSPLLKSPGPGALLGVSRELLPEDS